MKTRIKLVVALIVIGIFGLRAAAWISQKLHMNFLDIKFDLDNDIL